VLPPRMTVAGQDDMLLRWRYLHRAEPLGPEDVGALGRDRRPGPLEEVDDGVAGTGVGVRLGIGGRNGSQHRNEDGRSGEQRGSGGDESSMAHTDSSGGGI